MNSAQRRKGRRAGNLVRLGRDAERIATENAALRAQVDDLTRSASEAALLRADIARLTDYFKAKIQRLTDALEAERANSRTREARLARVESESAGERGATKTLRAEVARLTRQIAAARAADPLAVRRRLRTRTAERDEARLEAQRLRDQLARMRDPLAARA